MGKCSICAILFIPPPPITRTLFFIFFFLDPIIIANNKRSHVLNYVTIRSLKSFTKQRNSSVKEGYKVYREIGDCLSFAYFRKIC